MLDRPEQDPMAVAEEPRDSQIHPDIGGKVNAIIEAADSYGTQHRRGAEEEARTVLADAEKEAKELRDAAQQKAEQIERDVGQRHETLKREARMLEARRQRVLESLRDLAAQLQDALVEPVGTPSQDEALMDALKVERR